MSCCGLSIRMEYIQSNPAIDSCMMNNVGNNQARLKWKCWSYCGIGFGDSMFPIKLNASHERHVKMLCPLNWIWSAVKSSWMVAVMLAKHSRKMQSMPYSYVLIFGPCGVQCQSGIMACSGHASLLLTSLIVFLQVIRIRTCLRLWSGRCGLSAITYA